MNMRLKTIHLLAIFLLCICPHPIYSTPAFSLDAPNQCLADISNAIENGDANAFGRLADVDAILNQGLDVFLEQAAKPENARYIPPMLALMLSQAASQPAVRALLLQEARSFLLNGISTGAFAGKKLSPAQQQGLLAPLFAHASIARKEIRHLGKAVADDENGWFLPFSIHDFGNGNDYAILGRFTPYNGGLRLTGIENLDQIFAQIQQEAGAKE